MTKSPETIDSYTILRELGYGGSAAIYLAQKKDDSRKVALKVLYPHAIRESGLVKRFEQEVRTVAELRHPNIIRIFDTKSEEETFFIAMEYIPGGSLREWLKKGPLPRSEAVHITKGIGTALIYAHKHKRKVIHRDLKPENILLDTRQDPVRPILTDFGLAKSLSVEDPTAVSIVTRDVIGSPHYMAPEQWHNETPTPVTDLYALAIIFFEMLAGQRPFEANSPSELLQKHLNESLPLLSSVASSDVGRFFDGILIRAADKNPTDRFQSVAEFIEAVEEANAKAEQAEQEINERQNQAAKILEGAQVYLQRDKYDPDKALTIIEVALEVDPGYVEALRLKGKIYFKQEQFSKALDSYQQAYKQNGDPSSKVTIGYLETLRKIAEISWNGGDHQGAVNRCHRIVEVLDETGYEDTRIQEIRKQVEGWLIEFGDEIFAQESPEDLDEAIKILDDEIRYLDELEADSESLRYKQNSLRAKKCESEIKVEEEAIKEILSKGSETHFRDQNVFDHYLKIDEGYQNLIKLQPNNYEWKENRRKKLKERTENRLRFARQAESKSDYEAALQHYRAIRDIEQKDYPDLSKELCPDLPKRIAELEKKAGYDGKYKKIRELVSNGKYQEALDRLEKDFINERNYEHRDVAYLLWLLVQAKKNNWELRTELENMPGVRTLCQHLVEAERTRVQQLRNMLEPWSEISKVIEAEKGRLLACEQDVNRIEEMLDKIEPDDAAKYRSELSGLKAQIEVQHSLLDQIDIPETAERFAAWLQKIIDFQAYLQNDVSVEDIQKFLSDHHEELKAIETDETLDTLHTVQANNSQVRRTIDQIRVQVKKQRIRVLTEELETLQQRKSTIIYVNLFLIFAGIFSLAINLLVLFLWNRQVTLTLVAKGIIISPPIIIIIVGLVMLYQRIRQQ